MRGRLSGDNNVPTTAGAAARARQRIGARKYRTSQAKLGYKLRRRGHLGWAMRQFRAAQLLWILDFAFAIVAARGTMLVAAEITRFTATTGACIEAGLAQPHLGDALASGANVCLSADSPFRYTAQLSWPGGRLFDTAGDILWFVRLF